jgi:hypothetical protein
VTPERRYELRRLEQKRRFEARQHESDRARSRVRYDNVFPPDEPDNVDCRSGVLFMLDGLFTRDVQ